MDKPFNDHHTIWCRKWYSTPIEQALRLHQSLIVPMYFDVHVRLHQDIEPPPKPTREEIIGALIFMEEELTMRDLNDYMTTVRAVGEHFISREQMIGDCLLRQLPYLEEGIYR